MLYRIVAVVLEVSIVTVQTINRTRDRFRNDYPQLHRW
jgi:hypothetical protein